MRMAYNEIALLYASALFE